MSVEEQKTAYKSDKNSLCYWYPKIKELNIPTPRTIIIPLTREEGLNWLEGKQDLSKQVRHNIETMAKELGYPLFMRTDEISGKFDWANACYVESPDRLFKNLSTIIEHGEMADIMGLPLNAVILRKYLKPVYKFTAHHGMPVTKERRYFSRDGKYECHHPYWFAKAINEGHHDPPLPKDWKMLLEEVNKEDTLSDPNGDAERTLLKTYAERATKALGGYWSTDFLYAEDRWWLTDMALGDISYHFESCTFAPKHKLKFE